MSNTTNLRKCLLRIPLNQSIKLYIYIYKYMLYIYIYIYIYTAIFPPSNNKCYPTTGSNVRNELQRTAKFYTQNFMFFLRTSSERFQILFALLFFHLLLWKILSVPSLSKNKFLYCYLLLLVAL